MTERLYRLALVGGIAVLVGLALGQPSPLTTASILAASVLLIAALVVVARVSAMPRAWAELAVGRRAKAHRESLGSQAEPTHPRTSGRPLARAPGVAASAA